MLLHEGKLFQERNAVLAKRRRQTDKTLLDLREKINTLCSIPRLVLATFRVSDFEKSNFREKENSKSRRESAYRVLHVHFQIPGGAWEYLEIQVFGGIADSGRIVGRNRSLYKF
jgi:hypothetical protein